MRNKFHDTREAGYQPVRKFALILFATCVVLAGGG